MKRNNILVIPYCRTSTNSTSQIKSGYDQFIQQKNILKNNQEISIYRRSGGNPFSKDFVDNIINKFNEGYRIIISVKSFDRLTRNYTDLDFLMKYCEGIQITSENNKIYNMKTDIYEITKNITKAVLELKRITEKSKNRFNFSKLKKDKRETCKINILNRYEIALQNGIVNACGVNIDFAKKVGLFIRRSQNLIDCDDWEIFFNSGKKLGLDKKSMVEKYKINFEITNKRKRNEDTIKEIHNNEIIEYVNEIFRINNYTVNQQILNDFFKICIKYGRHIDRYNLDH